MTEKRAKQEELEALDVETIEEPCKPARYEVLRRLCENPDNHVAVSFGGGSLRGMAGNCALAAMLEELDLKQSVREVWGTSAGSIVGGSWASGTTPPDMLRVIEGLGVKKPLSRPPWWKLLPKVIRWWWAGQTPDGFFDGKDIYATIQEAMSVELIEDCPMPFRALAATDDGKFNRVVFRKGLLAEACYASMSIPAVVQPLESWNEAGRGYFDGGLVEKTPLRCVLDEHANKFRESKLLILCTHFDKEGHDTPPKGLLERGMTSIAKLEELVWEHERRAVQESKKCNAIVLNPRMKYGSMFDFGMLHYNYLWARRAFKEQLSNAGLATRFGAP